MFLNSWQKIKIKILQYNYIYIISTNIIEDFMIYYIYAININYNRIKSKKCFIYSFIFEETFFIFHKIVKLPIKIFVF